MLNEVWPCVCIASSDDTVINIKCVKTLEDLLAILTTCLSWFYFFFRIQKCTACVYINQKIVLKHGLKVHIKKLEMFRF